MKNRCEIWLSVLEELGALCSVSTTHDAISVVRRVENEGESFFTKTLPSYAKDLERSLDAGEIPTWLFSSFARRRLDVVMTSDGAGSKVKRWSSRGAPKFLGGFLDIVFDSRLEMSDETYYRLLDGDGPVPQMRCTDDEAVVAHMATAIWAVRQLCLMFSKEKALCSDELIVASIEKYALHDDTLIDPLSTAEAISFSEMIFSAVFDRSRIESLELP